MHKGTRDVHVTTSMGQDLYVCECMRVQTSMGRVVRPTRFKPTSMIGLVNPVWVALVCTWWNPNSLTLFNLYVPYFSWHFVFPTHHESAALPCKFDRLSQMLSFNLSRWVYCMKEKRKRSKLNWLKLGGSWWRRIMGNAPLIWGSQVRLKFGLV